MQTSTSHVHKYWIGQFGREIHCRVTLTRRLISLGGAMNALARFLVSMFGNSPVEEQLERQRYSPNSITFLGLPGA